MNGLHHHVSAASEVFGTYSHAVSDGRYAFLSGQLAGDAVGQDLSPGDIEAETDLVMRTLSGVLADLDLTFRDVLRVNIYMTDLGQFERMDRVYGKYFEPGRFPARTTVGVASLLLGGQIEIDCVALVRTE